MTRHRTTQSVPSLPDKNADDIICTPFIRFHTSIHVFITLVYISSIIALGVFAGGLLWIAQILENISNNGSLQIKYCGGNTGSECP